MEYKDIFAMLSGTGMPVAFRAFQTPQTPPFICWLTPLERGVSADNINYVNITRLQIELYTSIKDVEAENKVELALTSASLFYTKVQVYITSEKAYQTIYETEVL